MSTTNKERTSCTLCHDRKVKCDRQRPGCQKCKSYGVDCPGYDQPKKREVKIVPWKGAERKWRHAGKQTTSVQKGASKQICQPDPQARVSVQDMYRLQILTNFLDLQLKGDQLVVFHNSDLASMPGNDLSTPFLAAALDTLCFVGLGTAHDDQNLLEEARVRYGNAIGMLSTELRHRKPSTSQFRPVATTMMVLRICEMFQAFTIEGGESGRSQGWDLHLDAVQRYMRACGPAKDLIQSDFDWKLFQNIRFCSLYLSMAKRTHSLFEEPEWLELSRERSKSDPAVALYDIRARVPGLLARCDKLMENETLYTSDLTSLYNDLYALRCDFGSWTISFGGTLGFDTLPQDLNLPKDAFADGQDEICYTFTDSNHASLRTSCWMMSLAVEGTILRLLYAYEDHVATASAPFIRPEIERAAYETATNLCRSVYWCCQPSIAQSPYVGNFILKFAKAYFDLVGLTNESNWCDAMAYAVHTQTQSNHEAAGQKSLLSALSQRPAGDDRFLSGVWLGRNPCQIFIDIAV